MHLLFQTACHVHIGLVCHMYGVIPLSYVIWFIGISPEFSRLWVWVTHVFFEQTIHSFLFKTSLKMQSGANTFLKTHFKFWNPNLFF